MLCHLWLEMVFKDSLLMFDNFHSSHCIVAISFLFKELAFQTLRRWAQWRYLLHSLVPPSRVLCRKWAPASILRFASQYFLILSLRCIFSIFSLHFPPLQICLILFNLLLVVLSYVSYKKALKTNFPVSRGQAYVISGDQYGWVKKRVARLSG